MDLREKVAKVLHRLSYGDEDDVPSWSLMSEMARNDLLNDVDAILALVEQERAELMSWINDLQSGMYINCVYCGHRYGPNEGTPVTMADILKEHIKKCPKHPMSAMAKRAESAEAREAKLVEAAEGIITNIEGGKLPVTLSGVANSLRAALAGVKEEK